MKYFPEMDDEERNVGALVKAATSKAGWRVLAIGLAILAIAGGILFLNFKNDIEKQAEVKISVKYEDQIHKLENAVSKEKTDGEKKLADQKESYEKKLANQKAEYEDKLASAQEKHNKEIEKKDKDISEKDAEIERLIVENKISFDEIETDIKTVGKLTTIDYRYTYAGTHEDTGKFFGLFELGILKNSFIAQWDGVVAVGVDLSKVKITANDTSKVITVSLPAAEIFYHDVDEESFKVLDERNNIFNPITVEDKIQFDIKYEKKIYEKITDNRLLEDAYDNAKIMIENMLKAVPQVAQQYKIQFQQIQ